MKLTLWCGALLAAVALCGAETVRFDDAAARTLPPHWTVAMTHEGRPPRWEVLRDDTAPSRPNVFAQVSTDRTAGRFPLAIYESANVRDGTVSVKFKTIAGSVDQAAGLVWRYRDPRNYYIARANALEENVVLYKVEKGQRLALEPKDTPSKTYGVKQRIPRQTWCTLSVSFHKDVFVVSFNGRKLFEVDDTTFPGGGKTGLWTKADSVTYFDDFEITQ